MPRPFSYTARNGRVTWKVRFRYAGRNCQETFDTQQQAQVFSNDVTAHGAPTALALLETQHELANTPTVDALARRHISALTGITDGTRLGYERLYARTWAPVLGRLPLPVVTRDHVARAVNDLSARYSDKSVANAHGLLAAMMAGAVRDGLIERSPCDGIRLPRRTEHQTAELRYLTPDEFARLLEHIPAHYRPLVVTLAGTGMRWGEAEALNVGDVDLAHGVVRITKAAKWNASKATREVGPPKTRKSRRTITLPPQVIEALTPLVDRPKSARLFLAPKGGELRHRTFYDDWKAACAAAELDPQPRIHDLRHSHVATLIAAGIPLPVIQARLGHESIKTTVDTYGGLVPDLQIAAAHAASVAFGALPTSSGRVYVDHPG